MRTNTNIETNTTNQPDLSIGRRSLLSNLLVGSAAVAAVTTAAAIPSVGRAAQEGDTIGVSNTLQALIADFIMASIRLNAIDMEGDQEAYRMASDARSKALVALAFYQPASLSGLSAKLAALIEFSEDTERWALRITAEDMNRLAEVR